MTGVSPEALASRFPQLFHMAEQGSWPSIERHGLLSTSALLDLFELQRSSREILEAQHRPESVLITHPIFGTAVIRDQKPMDDRGLAKALKDGLSPSEWYRILNDKVFFWLRRERLERLLNAKAYRARKQTVLTIDTARLLAQYAERVVLSPMNSGCTKPIPHPRGRDTFLPLREYPFEDLDRKRRRIDPVVELAVLYAIVDVRDFVTCVEEVGGGESTIIFRS